jgi:hypothetical protein
MVGKEDGEESAEMIPRPPTLLRRLTVGLILGRTDLRIHQSNPEVVFEIKGHGHPSRD